MQGHQTMEQCDLLEEFQEVWKGCVWEDLDRRTKETHLVKTSSLCLRIAKEHLKTYRNNVF